MFESIPLFILVLFYFLVLSHKISVLLFPLTDTKEGTMVTWSNQQKNMKSKVGKRRKKREPLDINVSALFPFKVIRKRCLIMLDFLFEQGENL